MFLPRVELLRPSTLGYVIATPSELLLLVGHYSSLMMRLPWLCMISPLAMMCASTTIYGYPFVDDAPPRVIHNWFVVDDVRPYNHVWLSHCRRCAPLATPPELLLLAGHNSSLMMRPQGLYIISLLSMMCASTTMYGYPIVDGAHAWQL